MVPALTTCAGYKCIINSSEAGQALRVCSNLLCVVGAPKESQLDDRHDDDPYDDDEYRPTKRFDTADIRRQIPEQGARVGNSE